MPLRKKIILAKQSADGNVIYHFLHDKIQQSCINNESFNELEAHHSIGQALLKKYSKNAPAEQLNKITHHLNKSAVMLTHNEIEELIDLNQRYGDQLINNLSDASAQYYYSTAISLYHKHGITNKKKLENLYFSKVTACQISGLTSDALETLSYIEKNLASKQNTEKALIQKIITLTIDSQYQEVVALGLNTLKNKNMTFIPSNIEILVLLSSTLLKLIPKINKLTKLPEKRNPTDIFESNVIFNLCDSAYFFNKKTYLQLICKSIDFTLKKRPI